MTSYTNVHLQDGTSTRERLFDEVELLKFKNEQLQKKLDSAYRELANIPAAVKEWGYVDITDPYGETIRLVKDASGGSEGRE